jgi:phospholipid-binding lipoprotein MlaA
MRLFLAHSNHIKRWLSVIGTMERSAFLAAFITFLAAGCAHGTDGTSSLGPSVVSPPSQAGMISSNPEQLYPESREMSAQSGRGEIGNDEEPDNAPPESVKDAAMPMNSGNKATDEGEYQDNVKNTETEEETITIADPLEPFNRVIYLFNDKFYFWMLKPVAQGYSAVVPEVARVGVKNFFSNLGFPIRFISCLLQAELKGAATEIGRFGINTTVGILGFMDPASSKMFDLQKQDTDLGLSLASYGTGHGFYIDWPILGPSSPRDSVGLVGDYFLYPVSYLKPWYAWLGARGYEEVNSTSLKIGDYESLKGAAIDPYVALRDAYVQYRQNQMKGRKAKQEPIKQSPTE